jgi:GntR family transcriptional regulator
MSLRLDKNSPLPLYAQLKEALSKMIEEKYKPGDLLPAEPEIEKMFGVSRVTVRQAMGALVEEGLVVKRQGKGTFVQDQKITHNLTSITSWTQEMRERGLLPKTVEMSISRMNPPKKIASMLNLKPDDTVIRIKRIRYANEEPICVMINYLKEDYVPDILESGFQEESLYEHLEKKYGIRIVKAQETVEAREASEYEAEVLHIQAWSPVLFVTRLSYLQDGSPLEVVHLTSRADRYQYQITLHARS